MAKQMRERGAIQRRYRALLARRGWTTVATYMRVEHREALERVKRRHGLRNLHEALDLVLAEIRADQVEHHRSQPAGQFTSPVAGIAAKRSVLRAVRVPPMGQGGRLPTALATIDASWKSPHASAPPHRLADGDRDPRDPARLLPRHCWGQQPVRRVTTPRLASHPATANGGQPPPGGTSRQSRHRLGARQRRRAGPPAALEPHPVAQDQGPPRPADRRRAALPRGLRSQAAARARRVWRDMPTSPRRGCRKRAGGCRRRCPLRVDSPVSGISAPSLDQPGSPPHRTRSPPS